MRRHKKALFTGSYWCIQICLTVQILVVIKWNSHKGEQANTSQSPVQATFQLKVHPIPEGTAQYSPQPPTPENHLQPAFYCGKFLSDLFSLVLLFFFPQLLFLVVNPCFGWAAKQLLCWSSQHTPAGKYFPARFLKTLQSQQNLPQRVAKGSTLITQLGAGERDDIDGKETLCLGSSGKEASWLRKKHWGSGQVSTIDAISKSN